jgi:PEP-CTERM motif
MSRRTVGFKLAFLVFMSLSSHAVAGGLITTATQTDSTSAPGVLVATNFGPDTVGIHDRLNFTQFNPGLGTLESINVTLTTTIHNDYVLEFPATPIMTTLSVATSEISDPSILSDPVKRALLTDGPAINLLGPSGTLRIFSGSGLTQPVDFVQMTKSSGTFSSMLSPADSHFIEPTQTTQSLSLSLTADNAPSLFSDFVGRGSLGLPVTATAFSSFFSSSGNGGGAVITTARASVSISYTYSAAPASHSAAPEPSSVFLLGLGIGIIVLACKMRSLSALVPTSKS